MKPGGSSNITLEVYSGNYPISGANVHWTVTLGRLTNMVNSTNSTGFASAFFTSGTVPGAALIVMNVSKPGYATFISETSVRIISPNATVVHSKGFASVINEKILFVPLWGLIIVAVVAASTGFLVIRRRRSASGDNGIDEEE